MWAEFRKEALEDGARFPGRGWGRPGVVQPFSGYLYGSELHSRSTHLLPTRHSPSGAAGVGRRQACPVGRVCWWQAVRGVSFPAVAAAFFAGLLALLHLSSC